MAYGGTPEEKRAKYAAATRRYRATEKGLETNRLAAARWQRGWRATEEGRAARRRRYAEDPNHRLANLVRCRINDALKGRTKSAKAMDMVGCSVQELRTHLESTFLPDFTWENHGSMWHIDHKVPCARFDLSDPEQQQRCFHWTNLRAYPADLNRSEGARREATP